MREKEKPAVSQAALMEALDTLTQLTEIDPAVLHNKSLPIKALGLALEGREKSAASQSEHLLQLMRDSFQVILQYLQHYYATEVGHLAEHSSIDAIRAIMTLVGKAASKIDGISQSELGTKALPSRRTKEYQELFSFYNRRIAPIVAKESISSWMSALPEQAIIELAKKEPIKITKVERLFTELESVKNDRDYELFLLRKEDGNFLYNPKLLRNLKLVSRFEEYFSNTAQLDAYQEIEACRSHIAKRLASDLLNACWTTMNSFVKNAKHYFDNHVATMLYRAIIALFLAANEPEVNRVLSKRAVGYFTDFLKFFRTIVLSHDYQKLIAYPQTNEQSVGYLVSKITSEMIRTLFTSKNMPQELTPFLEAAIAEGKVASNTFMPVEQNEPFSNRLTADYEALTNGTKYYHSLNLIKLLDALEDNDIVGFDPLLMQNIPSTIFEMTYPGRTVAVLRLPTPTNQEYVNKAQIIEEFKGFLRNLKQDKPARKLLLFNLQDRTKEADFARSRVLEELQNKEEFASTLQVVTLSKAGDFYNQTGYYQDQADSKGFIAQLIEHTMSENSGFSYPKEIYTELFSGFVEELANTIHTFFFTDKKSLTRTERLDFIELFYLFVELKIIELVEPDSMSFSCKDALDIGMPSTVALFMLLKLLNARPVSVEEERSLEVLLFAEPLIQRGRNLFVERLTRLVSLLKTIESVRDSYESSEFHKKLSKALSPLYTSKILEAIMR